MDMKFTHLSSLRTKDNRSRILSGNNLLDFNAYRAIINAIIILISINFLAAKCLILQTIKFRMKYKTINTNFCSGGECLEHVLSCSYVSQNKVLGFT
jgi:hypothetical protein